MGRGRRGWGWRKGMKGEEGRYMCIRPLRPFVEEGAFPSSGDGLWQWKV